MCAILPTNYHRHPFLLNLMDANISHFLQLWLSEPIKFCYQKVNANCAPNTVLSINLLTGFCAVEATILSYKFHLLNTLTTLKVIFRITNNRPFLLPEANILISFSVWQLLSLQMTKHGLLLVLLVGIL